MLGGFDRRIRKAAGVSRRRQRAELLVLDIAGESNGERSIRSRTW